MGKGGHGGGFKMNLQGSAQSMLVIYARALLLSRFVQRGTHKRRLDLFIVIIIITYYYYATRLS